MFTTHSLSSLSSETKKIKITGYVPQGPKELKVRFTEITPVNMSSAIDLRTAF